MEAPHYPDVEPEMGWNIVLESCRQIHHPVTAWSSIFMRLLRPCRRCGLALAINPANLTARVYLAATRRGQTPMQEDMDERSLCALCHLIDDMRCKMHYESTLVNQNALQKAREIQDDCYVLV